jgi:hypothetical protein
MPRTPVATPARHRGGVDYSSPKLASGLTGAGWTPVVRELLVDRWTAEYDAVTPWAPEIVEIELGTFVYVFDAAPTFERRCKRRRRSRRCCVGSLVSAHGAPRPQPARWIHPRAKLVVGTRARPRPHSWPHARRWARPQPASTVERAEPRPLSRGPTLARPRARGCSIAWDTAVRTADLRGSDVVAGRVRVRLGARRRPIRRARSEPPVTRPPRRRGVLDLEPVFRPKPADIHQYPAVSEEATW